MIWTRANVTEVAKAERGQFHSPAAIHIDHLKDDAGESARQIIEELRRQSERFAAQAEARARQSYQREAGRHTKKWVASVSVGAQVDISKLLADDDLVDLISIKSEQFVSLIKGLSGDIVTRIEREVLGSIFEGRSNADIAKALTEIDGIGRRRARLIARDQASKLNGAMNEFRQRQAGVTHYRWKTILDGRERQSHHDRNEKVFAWDKPPSGGPPGTEINCRCRALAVLIDDPEDAAGIGLEGDPEDPFDKATNDPLIDRVSGTMHEDVLSWPRDAALIRQAEAKRVKEIVAAAKAEASFLESDAEALFEQVFGFTTEGKDLTRMSGSRVSFAKRRTQIFSAIEARLLAIEELLEHAADTSPN